MPKNLVLSLQFFRRAAELGDAEAHGEMGIRSSFGLHSDSTVSWSKLVSKFVKVWMLQHLCTDFHSCIPCVMRIFSSGLNWN